MASRTCDCGSCKKCKRREYMRRYYHERSDAEGVLATKTYLTRSSGGYVERVCVGCGSSFQTTLRMATRPTNPKTYCSRDCKVRTRNSSRTPEENRKSNLWKLYKITPEDYDARLETQGGKCAICASSDPGRHEFFHVDHDHETGRIRGLLCAPCNRGLGFFGDSSARLRAAADYLSA